ncbi:L,D-transpeptidase family protein [Flavisolibacter nicotianae]|uniref:L,D-transpeptidase family protein n=1 Tax=Flavisolibacter nicotianae TaxID=2364882 RepID=UPI0013C4E8D1|nr:L,D-transpeptidase family protein [Flavisolibacter nicotianae]
MLWFFASRCNSAPPLPENPSVKIGAPLEKDRNEPKPVKPDPAATADTMDLKNGGLVKEIYQKTADSLLWSAQGKVKPEADSLLALIDQCRFYGLFPVDYLQKKLTAVRSDLQKPGSAGLPPNDPRWLSFDLMATSSFIQLVKDIKLGRLAADSVLMKDSSLNADFFLQQKNAFATGSITSFTQSLEPTAAGYHHLKTALRRFLRKANLKRFTLIKTKDSLLWPGLVYQRLAEEDTLKLKPVKNPDSLTVSKAILKYQKWKKLKQDGLVSPALVNRLNATDLEAFLRVAITLDKYKMLPSLQDDYIWVNLPGFYLEVRHGDTTILKSKIICGKPETRTPQLTSVITDMITYPQWTIPESIIKKEILPGLKRDAGYTRRKGFSLVDNNGNEINPYTVNWAKFKNVIPYRVVQGSGDDNALGVMKFNFTNPYAVYLHDTNQRYLFGKSSRALSHGCVRVQQWKQLADFILHKEKLLDSVKAVPIDSVNKWLAAKKKKVIRVKQQLPLFIRYFSAEGHDGKLVLYDDIYEEDKRIREKYFATK